MEKEFPMAPLSLFPDAAQIDLIDCTIDPVTHEITATVATKAVEALCPLCQQPSKRVHSRYRRQWADLPCCGQSVRWIVEARRFRCQNLGCARKIFCERLPACAPAYARRTVRATQVLIPIAFALGGRAGAKLVKDLNMLMSHDTLLRLIRRQADPSTQPVRILGVDDWSYRRGKRYGTLLVNLETRRPIDVLPDRTAATLAGWLANHPEILIISRDRGGEYALGARQGAPQAVQVADRFHVIRNLAEALERGFHRHRQALKQIRVPVTDLRATPLTVRYARPDRERRKGQAREQLVERYEAVQRLVKQGVSHLEIARRLHLHRESVIRYARAESFPEKPPRSLRPGILTPYEPYLRARYQEGYRNELGLWREITAQGFAGTRMTVVRFVLGLRQLEQQGMTPPPTSQTTELTPRRLVGLLLQHQKDLTQQEVQALAQARQLHPDLERAASLFHLFLQMVRQRRGEELDGWLHAAFHSGIPELRSFVVKLRQDQEAVQAGFIFSWSNGIVEGHVHRLKYFKRQMYGRANFDLLRQRVLRVSMASS
jgi:transposase